MKTILLVGKYFPSFSVEAVQLHYLAMDLKKTGYRIILVSDAWCNTEREAFIGDAQDLGDESVFDRKYYLDPLQESVMGQKASRGILLYGLCCEVIRSENITSVLLMDLLPYGYMSTLLKDEFPTLKVYLYLGASSWFATVYKGNIIKNLIMDCQSYTKYRPNETTGGIFVSWRRKEELPTGT